MAPLRILYASFFLVVGIPTFSWVSANPPGFFHPPPLSIAAWLSGFPDAGALRVLDVSICVLLVFLLVYERSDAVLKALIDLGGSFPRLAVLWLVPRALRDVAYRIVSNSRYRLFGKRQSCRVPAPQERSLFI